MQEPLCSHCTQSAVQLQLIRGLGNFMNLCMRVIGKKILFQSLKEREIVAQKVAEFIACSTAGEYSRGIERNKGLGFETRFCCLHGH